MSYDSYTIIIKHNIRKQLVAYINYYNNRKLINQRRTTNKKIIKSLLDSVSLSIKCFRFNNDELIIPCDEKNIIKIEKFNTLKDREDIVFYTLDKKISKLMKTYKKRSNINSEKIKNLKINERYKKTNRFKLVVARGLTAGFLVGVGALEFTSLIVPVKASSETYIEENYIQDDNLNIEKNVDIPIVEYKSNNEISVQSIENSVKEISINDSYLDDKQEIINDENIDSISGESEYHSVVPTFEASSYDVSEEDFQKLVAMVQAEAGGYTPDDKYTDSMAVTCSVLNRLEDEKWRESCGDTIIEQVTAPGQYDGINTKTYEKVCEDINNASPEVICAVRDTLNGTRNSEYLSFRSKNAKSPDREQFVNGGNNHFDKLKKDEEIKPKSL